MKTMSDVLPEPYSTDIVWPELSDSSSDNESSTDVVSYMRPFEDNQSSVTIDEINGEFPPLRLPDDKGDHDESGNSESEQEERKIIKNPYLQQDERLVYNNKLRELHLKRNEARKLNHQEVAAEDQRKKLPANYEAMRRRAEWELEDRAARKSAEDAGEIYEEVKLLGETAEEIEIFERKKRKKKNQDPGFSDYATSQLRQYERLTKQMKPDLDYYNRSKEKLGNSAFPGAHNLMYGGSGRPSEDAIDHMVEDLEKQIDKRSKFHRRRQHNEDADVDYINERNAKFNQKAERFYGQYTQEIKNNLERGTAI